MAGLIDGGAGGQRMAGIVTLEALSVVATDLTLLAAATEDDATTAIRLRPAHARPAHIASGLGFTDRPVVTVVAAADLLTAITNDVVAVDVAPLAGGQGCAGAD